MTIRLSDTLRSNRADEITTSIDAGGAAATLEIWEVGTPPPTLNNSPSAPADTLLVSMTMSYPSAPAASGGVITFNTIADGTAAAGGTANFALIKTSAGTNVMFLSVGDTNSSEDIKLNSTNIISGGPVKIISASLTEGNA